MYRVSPVPKASLGESDLPKCMYKMPFLFDQFDNVKLAPNGVCPSHKHDQHKKITPEKETALKQLVGRQEQLIKKLSSLEEEVKNVIAGVFVADDDKPKVVRSQKPVQAPKVEPAPVAVAAAPEKAKSKKKSKAKSPGAQTKVTPEAAANVQPKAAKSPTPASVHEKPAAAPIIKSGTNLDFSIHADINSPPAKVQQLVNYLRDKQQRKILLKSFYHSTIAGKTPVGFTDIGTQQEVNRSSYDFIVTIIVKDLAGGLPYLVANPSNCSGNIVGEKNIIQHIAKTLSLTNLPQQIVA